MLLLSTAVLLGSGPSVATLWTSCRCSRCRWRCSTTSGRACALACADLRLAAAGLRLGAARAFLWAVLPLLAIGVVEKIAFNTSHFAVLLEDRLSGGARRRSTSRRGMASRWIR